MLLHDRKVCTEALNPVLEITEFADGAEHFTPPGEYSGSKLVISQASFRM